MKSKIAILSSLLCMFGTAASASDCMFDDCFIEPINTPAVGKPVALPTLSIEPTPVQPDKNEFHPMPAFEYGSFDAPDFGLTPVKLVSVKPVEKDNRAPLWDGNDTPHKIRSYDKTVDWRDGVPIWDDSISSYKDKDFSDWFSDPLPVVYVEEANTDYFITRDEMNREIESLLAPLKPTSDLWTNSGEKRYEAQDLSKPIMEVFEPKTINITVTTWSDGCPFELESECKIWRRKPTVRETVSPRSPKIRNDKMDEFICAINANPNITANDRAAAPLLDRYKMLMQSANSCCSDGMAYNLKRAGASDGLVYKFMSDDANFYGFGSRCLMMTDQELDTKYPNTATAAIAADVRNGCLCRGRQWFYAMLAPFEEAYRASPEFANARFNYTYTDGLQREITTSVNTDVQNVLKQLALCP